MLDTNYLEFGRDENSCDSLIKSAYTYLKNSEWDAATEYFNKALKLNDECSDAYLGIFLAEIQIKSQKDLIYCQKDFQGSYNYQMVLKYCTMDIVEYVKGCISKSYENTELQRKEDIYQDCISIMEMAESEDVFKELATRFESLGEYKDSAEKSIECKSLAEKIYMRDIYAIGRSIMNAASNERDYENAIKELEKIIEYKDSRELIQECLEGIEKVKILKQESILKRKKRTKKIINSVLLVMLLLLLVAGHIFISPIIKYNKAMEYYNEGRLEKAYELCKSLCKNEPYKDCEDIMYEIESEALYQKGERLLNEGKYDDAITVFESLEGYKYSDTHIKEAKYQKAIELLDKGNYDDAITIFNSLRYYKDSSKYKDKCEYDSYLKDLENGLFMEAYVGLNQMSSYGKINDEAYEENLLKAYDGTLDQIQIELLNASVGDVVKAITVNGTGYTEWKVVDKVDNKVLLILGVNSTVCKYNDVNAYLKGDVFDKKIKMFENIITDTEVESGVFEKAFLLSWDEVQKYNLTQYGEWWTRTGTSDGYQMINTGTTIQQSTMKGVRPAIWIEFP